ncbi:hypothetical protein [Streptomyces sp. NPDC047453]|uniref:hypothetical protein n=1 Tax=Streptomyces sp. NPDC047453 TaxID=3154812 RepID=UPI0033D0C48B
MPYERTDRRDGRPALRLRTLWYRCWGAGAALLGVALLVAAGAGLTTVTDHMTEERAYRAARPCGRAVTEDCLRSVQATVRDTVIQKGPKQYARYALELGGPVPVPREVAMKGAEPLLRHLRAGDVVTVTMWRDYAIAVDKDGVTQRSKDTPEGRPGFTTAAALGLITFALFVVREGGHVIVRAPGYAATGVPAGLARRGRRAVVVVACALPAGLFGKWTGPVGVIVLWSALVGLLFAVFRLLDTRRRGRHAAPYSG